MDTSISADESEFFEAPNDINASPRIEASTESPIPAESTQSRSPSKMKGKHIVPKAPKKVRDEAQEALTAALDQVPELIHFRPTREEDYGNPLCRKFGVQGIRLGLAGGTR